MVLRMYVCTDRENVEIVYTKLCPSAQPGRLRPQSVCGNASVLDNHEALRQECPRDFANRVAFTHYFLCVLRDAIISVHRI